MKVRCIQNSGIIQREGSDQWTEDPHGLEGSLTIGKIYEVLEIEGADYRIIDDEGEDYLYPADFFEVVELTSLERHLLSGRLAGI
ncbi:MAG: hypothetical protein HY731_09320 [Candidatus Tectomicrobia bacterium]|nr:hypothetical protein [Candidatus Tectomicrobia bacterium]